MFYLHHHFLFLLKTKRDRKQLRLSHPASIHLLAALSILSINLLPFFPFSLFFATHRKLHFLLIIITKGRNIRGSSPSKLYQKQFQVDKICLILCGWIDFNFDPHLLSSLTSFSDVVCYSLKVSKGSKPFLSLKEHWKYILALGKYLIRSGNYLFIRRFFI